MKNKKELAPEHYFELLDRSHVLEKYFNEVIVKHPLVDKLSPEKDIKKLVGKIGELLGELTQMTGTRCWDIDDEVKSNEQKPEA